ncbi:MAG: CRISPR system precrRNA processing endoribonuclease RAMP protein Cas6 [Chloroflexota bacterium]|nr:CRISPR system precrRNA processing endoribonuclease RAMP protein Cas6 [Chloroflexota bacterium]
MKVTRDFERESAALLSAVIIVKPLREATVPSALGRHIRAWFLSQLQETDPALAHRLHEGSRLRPYTVSNLYGAGPPRDGRVFLWPDQECRFRVTALTDELSATLLSRSNGALPEPGDRLRLDRGEFVVQDVIINADEDGWAGQASYEALLRRHALETHGTPRSVVLHFSSPTLVRRNDKDMPLPLPRHVFQSYLQKWNAFAPQALPEEAARYADECVALGRFKIESHLVSFEEAGKGAHVGFTGYVRFRFLVGDPYWTRLMRLLAEYAFWCGTGYRTTVGLGQTHLLRKRL